MQPKQIYELKILDLSTVLAGPSVGTFFSELGAQVIKIENPVFGDVTNSWRLANEQNTDIQSAYYSSVNYQKEKRKLNFQDQQDYSIFLKELADTDIVLMNFKKGDDFKLKLDEQTLWKHKPGLIIGKITGFGSDSDRIAYDLILQAETGFMSMNGNPESEPTKMPVALIDVLAAHQLKEGLLLALLKNSQQGQLVCVSLYDAAVCSLANQASNYLMAGHIPQRIGSLHPNIAPYGEIFQTKDAKQITFAIGSDQHFEKLVNFLGFAELATDPRFSANIERVKNRAVLFQLLEPVIAQKTSSEICYSLIELNVPVAQIKALDEVFTEQAAQNLVRSEQIGTQLTKRVTQIAFQIHDSNT
jgi:crotonobetainyl-CoA:carnitine CoA-transferase CaiB-like acyl-CoA transferase